MKLLPVIALTVAAMTATACSEEKSALNLPPGKYENTEKSTDSRGTDVKKDTTTEVGYDAYGNKTAVTKTKTTHDPKGLFNKSTSTKTQVIKEDR